MGLAAAVEKPQDQPGGGRRARLGSVWAVRGWRGASRIRHRVETPPVQRPSPRSLPVGQGCPRPHSHLGSLHPSRPGVRSLTSDPARDKVFQLEVAHGPGRGTSLSRSWSVPIQCLLDRACGQARQTGEVRDTDSSAGRPPPHRAAPLPAWGARGRLTSRPQWTLKAQSAGRRGSIHLQLFMSLRHWK